MIKFDVQYGYVLEDVFGKRVKHARWTGKARNETEAEASFWRETGYSRQSVTVLNVVVSEREGS